MANAQGGGGGGSNRRKKKSDQDLKYFVGGGAAAGAAGGAGYGPDPMEELQRLIDSMSGGQGNDYYADASQIYQPQFSYLDQLGRGAESRTAEGSKKLKGLYGALQSGIKGQEGGIRKNYDMGQRDVGAAYNQALDAVGDQFDNTRNNSAEILQRLGIEQAGSNVVGKSNQMEALLSGILGANNMATQNNLRQGEESAVTYNTQQAGAAGLAGAEAQTGLQNKLADFMSQLAGKKADLQSQVQQSAFGMEQDASKSALQAAQDRYKQMIDERDFNYKVGHDKALLDARTTGDSAKLDPGGNMESLALNLYGNQQSAGNAVNAIMQALSDTDKIGGTGKPSLGVLLKVLEQRLTEANGGYPGDMPKLARLAQLLYQ